MSDRAAAIRGTVRETLPNGRYRCELEGGAAMVCHVSGGMRLEIVRILPGDVVVIEPSPFDPSKGRIVDRAGPGGDAGGPGRLPS